MEEINSDDKLKKRYRNLRQNKNLSDEDFNNYWDKKLSNAEPSAEFERRIQRKIDDFSKDYDIEDLKINDKAALRALVQAELALEDYEQMQFRARQDGDLSNGMVTSKIMSDLRSDISKLQGDLNITRKIRKSDKEASVVNYVESLKAKAKQFAESKMSYIVCPKCNMLLATVWAHYPEADNKLRLTCKRKLADGTTCNEKIVVTTEELAKKNTNNPGVIPESLL